MSNNSNVEEEEIKIILLGDSGVGKTNLINTYIGKEFQEDFKSTISGSFANKELEIEDKKYSLYLWDTAGQERFRGVTKLLFKGSQIVILVFDITNKDSFKSLNYWVEASKNIIEDDFIFGVAANKIDLFTKEEEETEQVTDEDIETFANSIGALHAKVSAKVNTVLFSLFMEELVKAFINKGKKKRRDSLKLKKGNKGNKKGGCCN